MASVTRRASDVRINEVDLSTSIMTNSNATAALVVVGKQGPLSPAFVSNYDDFRSIFGEPDASVSFDHYAAQDYFAEGNSLWGVRAVGQGALYSGVSVYNMQADDGETGDPVPLTFIAPLAEGTATPDEPDFAEITPTGSVPLFQVTPKNGPGSYANNIAISIQSAILRIPTGLVGVPQTTTSGDLTAGDYYYSISARGRFGETLACAEVHVVLAGAQNTVKLNWDRVPGAVEFLIYRRTEDFGIVETMARIDNVGGFVTQLYDQGFLANEDLTPITDPASLTLGDGTFTLNVFDITQSTSRPVESWNVTLTDRVDETGTQMEIMQRVNSFSNYIRVESDKASWLNGAPPVFSSNASQTDPSPVSMLGGTSGAAPTAVDINTALNLFSNRELYTIDVFIAAGRTVPEIVLNGNALAAGRNDAVYFADVPSMQQSYQAAIDYRNQLNLNSSYTALFCSDLLELDPITAKQLYVPPSGAMAGLYARTSRIAQPWFSIAGLNRGLLNVLGVRDTYDDGQATLMFQSQVNYMRKFVGRGIALWEQATLYDANSALQFLNVRFLLNILKRSMYDYLLYGLQEQNDDILHKQLKFSLETYLDTIQRARGIKTFRVVISSVNNPPALVNSGILAIAVIIQPILPVREIQLTLVVTKEGLEVDEQTIASL